MRITPEQQRFLDDLICERLAKSPDNIPVINGFQSKNAVGRGMISDLQKTGCEEDEDGAIAYYIIKDKNSIGYCFFSLKCGSLFDPSYDNNIKDRVKRCRDALEYLCKEGQNKTLVEKLSLIEQIRRGWGLTDDQINDEFDGEINEESIKNKLRYYENQIPDNKKLLCVEKNHSGVELVHFCANDSARYHWHNSGINKPMGEVLFWHSISEITTKIRELVGCQYIYLFAADLTQDKNLVNHYRISMKFEEIEDLGTCLPEYDVGCTFMLQEISELKQKRKSYFDTFNPDLDDVVI